ncbi:vacuolar protein 14 C-terminal Fig4p binding-domain-containing protein [Protomyces lactucae-debilis]|uniref:Vacuolar protein 14 C-terminal Fig4p binding-domain-containing protein n=1 Tax=Protomyces lactucae-debilis TaxID=2754530 RepID=A0A1Y2FKJ4_PROLT|nr:vacuolar protein 14 C-terminal Fig4p binding-domain-containing protein [Protomyces lactucae-debilis]ORY84502.1 vacuolar protein 14 C-terminal Fig4p binding-domain-containing protein [Protomyces lactucae-debilis]
MEETIAAGLANKIYEKRKVAAYELEKLIRDAAQSQDHAKVQAVIDQLCNDFIGTSQKAARSVSGGLIGLAATSIALGKGLAVHLDLIIPSVLSCFSNQDARIRYYSTESLYNIAKVAKGEILLYFNEIFDALCRLSADSEISVKNGAELLDRLIKDIVSEKATEYVSVLQSSPFASPSVAPLKSGEALYSTNGRDRHTAFSLNKFIPLLSERMYVLNPFTRIFLVSWITVLNSIPDLDLVVHLPQFLDGILNFLSDSHQDVRIATSKLLADFLAEIKKIADVKRIQANTKRSKYRVADSSHRSSVNLDISGTKEKSLTPADIEQDGKDDGHPDDEDEGSLSGLDLFIDYTALVRILLRHLNSHEEAIQLTALTWLSEFFSICPLAVLEFMPKLLEVFLPTISHDAKAMVKAASEVNDKSLKLIRSVIDGTPLPDGSLALLDSVDLDFGATVSAATIQLLDDHVDTRVSALGWLMELHRMAPSKILTLEDGTFPILLKTLSDTSEKVVTKDLQLLAQISSNSADDYFKALCSNLLTLFSSDRKLLETRGSLIIRQLSIYLNAERIYRTLAESLEKEDDLEFGSTMVQHLNNNLLTAPELFDLRKRLRNMDSRDGQSFFTALYRCFCHNAVATFSLCLLAQAYEQAFNLLQIFADLEITIHLLIQIDKLVHLLESPIFTYLRLQLLDNDRYPFLHKCLYGLLMLLPQTSAFTILRNRLNSIQSIPAAKATQTAISGTVRKGKDEVPFAELLAKFRSVQVKHERARQISSGASIAPKSQRRI